MDLQEIYRVDLKERFGTGTRKAISRDDRVHGPLLIS
jgi:hypothetical protein